MTLAALQRFFPRYAIARAIANGLDLDHAKLDTMFADVGQSIEAMVTRLNAITNISGTLKNLATATAQALAGSQTFTATAAQTAFTTTIVWSAAFTSANVAVFQNGVRIRPSLVTVSNSGGFLRVTIAAQTVGTIIVVDAFESGAGVLTRLLSIANGDGASLIGIEDLEGNFTADDVEGALEELSDGLTGLIASLGNLSTICRTTGFTMTGAIAMGGNTLGGLAAAASAGQAVRWEQIQAAALLVDMLPEIATSFLALSGGTMSGPIDMSNQLITDLAPGVAGNDGVNKAQLDAVQTTVTATLRAPPGALMDWPGLLANIPTGWLHCDGSLVSRTTYANLFAAIGVVWGAGDTLTTFNLPDLRGYTTIGAGAGVIDKVTAVTITAAGSGYVTAPTVTFTGGGGVTQATAEAAIDGGGTVVSIRLLTRGVGYTSAPTIVISGGSGTGATATASVSLTTRVLAEILGEESHIMTEAELAKHRHLYGLINSASAGAGAGGSFGNSQYTDYTGTSAPFNLMQPSKPVYKLIKT